MFTELEKIINDGKQKLKAFEVAETALEQAKGLAQYEAETRKKLDDLLLNIKKTETKLAGLVDKESNAEKTIADKISTAEKNAADIIYRAKSESDGILEKTRLDAEKYLANAITEKNNAIELAETKRKEALEWEARVEAAKLAVESYRQAMGV